MDNTVAADSKPVMEEEVSYRKKFLQFVDRFYSERLVLGSTSIAVFALVVSLIVYAFYSWVDTFKLGMSQREQVLHIAIPIFIAIALIPVGAHNLYGAFEVATLEDKGQQ